MLLTLRNHCTSSFGEYDYVSSSVSWCSPLPGQDKGHRGSAEDTHFEGEDQQWTASSKEGRPNSF